MRSTRMTHYAGQAAVVACKIVVNNRAWAEPGEWPQFRGPNRDGVSSETGLLKEWPAGGPPLAWKATGLGNGYSTVAVVGGRIYTIGDQGAASLVEVFNV